MTGFRLTRQAEQSLEQLFGWTLDTFGVAQAEQYKDQLVARLTQLAAGHPPHGRPCSALVEEQVRDSGLTYYREGRHYIIYCKVDDELLVVDFVHASRNLTAIVDLLSRDPKTGR